MPAVGAVAVALAGGAGVRADGRRCVVATDRDGDTVAELGAAVLGGVELTDRHSYYRRPAVERFGRGDGSFRLVEIASPSEAVLEYSRSRARADAAAAVAAELARPVRFERMALAATGIGRRTLAAGGHGRRCPGPRARRHLTITVEGS